MFTAKQDVVSRRKEDMLILLRTSTGHYYTLNHTGALLWEHLIDKQRPIEQCVSAIAAESENPPDAATIRSDCEALIDQWRSEQLIEAQV